ncbi:MAG: hypothetical protein ACTS3T_08430 [Almyronema sp.]
MKKLPVQQLESVKKIDWASNEENGLLSRKNAKPAFARELNASWLLIKR